MPKQETLARLHETVENELAIINDHGDELLEATDAGTAASLGSQISELIKLHADSEYYSTQERPTPLTNLAATMLFNLRTVEQHPGVSFISSFLETRLEPFAAKPDQPQAREIGFKVNHAQACPIAESSFRSVFQQIKRERYYPDQRLISAYHDDEGTPVLLRKSDIETTALTLVPLRTEGIVLPAGAIVGVNKSKSPECTGRKRHSNYTYESWRLTEEDTIHPLRLSAWAYEDPIDRSMFACYGWLSCGVRKAPNLYYDRYRAEMLQRISLEGFISAASKIVELCAG